MNDHKTLRDFDDDNYEVSKYPIHTFPFSLTFSIHLISKRVLRFSNDAKFIAAIDSKGSVPANICLPDGPNTYH